TVFLCEGEKDADRVASLGHCTTCVAAGKWTDECIKGLAGRDVWILEDNDSAGREKAQEAASQLQAVAKSIRIIRLPGLADKQDVSDWLDAGHTNDELIDVCYSAPPWEPAKATPPASSWKFYSAEGATEPPRWLVKSILPETGTALLSGQWGAF